MNDFQRGDRIRVERPGVAHQHGREGLVLETCIHFGKPACLVQLDRTDNPATPCRFPIPVEYLRLIGHQQQHTENPGDQT